MEDPAQGRAAGRAGRVGGGGVGARGGGVRPRAGARAAAPLPRSPHISPISPHISPIEVRELQLLFHSFLAALITYFDCVRAGRARHTVGEPGPYPYP